MNIKTIAILLPCWLILLCLSGCGHKPYARQYKIALVHSYEEGYPDAERTAGCYVRHWQSVACPAISANIS